MDKRNKSLGLVEAEEAELPVGDEPRDEQREKQREAKDKLEKLCRHIENVKDACALLGRKLIDKGEIEFGIRLTALGYIHDFSKFSGIEWQYLVAPEEFNGEAKLAARHHASVNKSHPEYWGDDIALMPRLYVAEFVCDMWARASEFGTDVREYIKDRAIPRYGISPQGKIYKWIKEFLDLLLEKPFVESPVDEE